MVKIYQNVIFIAMVNWQVQCSKDSDHVVVSFTVEAADDFECPYPQCKSREFKDDVCNKC